MKCLVVGKIYAGFLQKLPYLCVPYMFKGFVHGKNVLGCHGSELYAHSVIIDIECEVGNVRDGDREVVLLKHIHDILLREHQYDLETKRKFLSSDHIVYVGSEIFPGRI